MNQNLKLPFLQCYPLFNPFPTIYVAYLSEQDHLNIEDFVYSGAEFKRPI